jgi:isopenicillin N synthase-like dioxygenase
MPFFYDPNYDAVIEPLKTCCGPHNPPKYLPITAGEHKMMKVRKSRVAMDEGQSVEASQVKPV